MAPDDMTAMALSPSGSNTCAAINEYNDEFKKIHAYGKKMCCSKHFVRNWHEGNGGGHGYDPKKLNDFNLENFQCLNWNDISSLLKDGVAFNPMVDPFEPFSCKGHGGGRSDCAPSFRPGISKIEAEEIQSEIAKYDMLGIPQIAINKTLMQAPSSALVTLLTKEPPLLV